MGDYFGFKIPDMKSQEELEKEKTFENKYTEINNRLASIASYLFTDVIMYSSDLPAFIKGNLYGSLKTYLYAVDEKLDISFMLKEMYKQEIDSIVDVLVLYRRNARRALSRYLWTTVSQKILATNNFLYEWEFENIMREIVNSHIRMIFPPLKGLRKTKKFFYETGPKALSEFVGQGTNLIRLQSKISSNNGDFRVN
jgi:hypothetical protein